MNRRRLGLYAVLFIAGCTSVPAKRPELVQVRADYAAVAAVPEIRRHAPVALHDANEAITFAAGARSTDEYYHQLYRARRLLQIAQAVTNKERVELEVQILSRERDRLRQAVQRREKALAEASARALEAELAALEARRTDRGVQVTLEDVAFEPNRADLTEGADDTLDALAAFLRDHTDRQVIIEAHTDSSGSEQYNQLLSERRADTIRRAIASRGVDEKRLHAQGFGETRPIASNDTDTGRRLNRRVEIVVLRDGLRP